MTPAMKTGRRWASLSARSIDVGHGVGTVGGRGEDVVAQRVDEVFGAFVLRRRRGDDRDHGRVTGFVDEWRRDGRHVARGWQGRGQRVEHGGVLVGRAGQLGGNEQRAVVARAEALGDEVVGLAGGGVRGVGPGVGGAEPHREERDGEDDQDRQRRCERDPGPSLDRSGPAVPPAVVVGAAVVVQERQAPPVDVVAGEPEERR
jgi:hypothetical protein